MTIRRLLLRRAAKGDLSRIVLDVGRFSGDRGIGRRIAADVLAKCRHLADLPGTIGRDRPELGPGIRSFPYRRYVIFFRYLGDFLEIVSIAEDARDHDTWFKKSEP